jgi:hypothetical protein
LADNADLLQQFTGSGQKRGSHETTKQPSVNNVGKYW